MFCTDELRQLQQSGITIFDVIIDREGNWLVIGVGGRVPIIQHLHPQVLLVDPADLVCGFQRFARRCANQAFHHQSAFERFPGQLKNEFEALDSAIDKKRIRAVLGKRLSQALQSRFELVQRISNLITHTEFSLH